MPIPVNFKGLAVIEYPDDWTEEMIREDARKNDREITAKITAALKDQAIAETAEDPENQPSGFLEHLGDAAMGVAQSAQRTIAAVPKYAGRAMEILGPEAFAQDPNLGGAYIPQETQKLWDELHRQRAAESPDAMRQRVDSNLLVQVGRRMEEDASQRFTTLPGAESRFWTGQVPQGLGTTVAGVAATLAGGPMAGAGMMFSAEAEDAWESELARQTESGEPYNPDKALLKSFGYGAFASAVESGLGVGRLSRKLRQAFGGSTKEAVQKAAQGGKLGRFLADVVKEGAAGFTEEAIQRLGQGLIVSGEMEVPEAVEEGLVGAVVQSGLGAPASAVEAFRGRRPAPAMPESARAVQETQARAGAAGVIREPAPLTEADLAEIEGVDEAAARQAAPDETKPPVPPPSAIPPLPVAEAGRASGDPEPEALPSILEQIRLTADPASSKAATLVTTGTEIPDFDSDVLLTVKTKHGTVIFNPDKIGPDEIQEAAKGDVFDGRVLGMADSGAKPTRSPVAVTTSTPAARNVVTELVAPTEEAIATATAAQQAAVPGGTTEVKPAAHIIAERREDRGSTDTGAESASEASLPARLMTPAEYASRILESGSVGGLAPDVAVRSSGSGPGGFGSAAQGIASPAFGSRVPKSSLSARFDAWLEGVFTGTSVDPRKDAQAWANMNRSGQALERQRNAQAAMWVQFNNAVSLNLPVNRKGADVLWGGPPPGWVPSTENGVEVYAPPTPISEPSQPAAPQQAPAGVVAPAPGGVVAPQVTSSTDETGRLQPNPPGAPAAEPATGEGATPRPKGAVLPVRPQPRDDGGKPGAQPSTQPKGGDQSALQEKEGEQAPVAPTAPRPAPETMPKTPAPATAPTADPKAKAAEDLNSALADLADLFGTKLNIVSEERQKVFPVLVRAFDAAFRLGYYKFKDAARYILRLLRERGAGNVADAITTNDLQGAYIAMSSAVGDQADEPRVVIGITKQDIDKTEDKGPPEPTGERISAAVRAIEKWLMENLGPLTRAEASQIVADALGSTVAQGKYTAKDVTDVVEIAVNRTIIANPELFGPNTELGLENLQGLLDRLPTQTTRSEETTTLQQFSTPPTLAWVAAWVAKVTGRDVVLEPSAGILGLGSMAKAAGAKVIANELSPRRRNLLRLVEGADVVLGENAEQLSNILAPRIANGVIPQPTVVIMNPPFSAAATTGEVSNTVGQQHLEEALKLLPKDGRLVIIMGEGMAMQKPRAVPFWRKIGSKYTIRANFGIDGSEYRKYGTNFGVQLIVIDNTGPTKNLAEVVTGMGTVAEAARALRKVRDERGTVEIESPVSGPAGAPPASSERQPGSGPGQRGSGRGGRGKLPSDRGVQPEPAKPKAGDATSGEQPGPGGRGEDAAAGTGGTGVAPPPAPTPGLTVTRADEAERDIESEEVFSDYKPQIKIPGAQPHPSPLVEPSAMASVRVPSPTYEPALPKELIESGAVSGAQLEQVVLAGQAHNQSLPDGRRSGYFIGDGTGVGKGRILAAIGIDNRNQGRPVMVWVSKTSNLAEDAKRDIRDLGLKDEEFHEFLGTKKVEGVKKGVIFTTYTSLAKSHTGVDTSGKLVRSTNQAKKTRVEQLYDRLGPDFEGVIVFDEAHLAGNAIDIKGKRGMKKASKNGKTVVDLQTLFPKARIVYSSATGATDVTNLSYAERLGIWGSGTPFPNKAAFFNAISAGGLSAMEIVARDLKAMGRYLARTLSFRGVERAQIVHPVTQAQREIYDAVSDGWQIVMRGVDAALQSTGAANNGRAVAAARSAMFGAQQRFYNQLLTAMQMPSVLVEIERDLAEGHQVVLQIVNTNEATLERSIAESTTGEEAVDLDEVDLSSKDVLIEYVDKSWPTVKYEAAADGNGNIFWRPVVDAEGNPVVDQEALAAKKEMLARIALLRAPTNPLEMLLDKYGVDTVAEVTGRKRRMVLKKDDRGQMRRQLESGRTKANRIVEAQEFNDGQRRILVFSDAGGTGFSYHSGSTFKNRKRRKHYLIQAGWRADAAIQGFGRTHRSNQAVPPFYKLFSTDIKGHQRFISTIARRLSELGALTGGERKSAGGEMFDETSNLENQYAEDAVWRLFNDLFGNRVEGFNFNEVSKRLGFWRTSRDHHTGEVTEESTLIDENGGLNEDKVPGVAQFLNRILILRLDEQNRLFEEFESRLRTRIEAAKSSGSYDPGLQTLKALAIRKVEEVDVFTHPQTGATTKLVVIEHDHPVTWNKWEDIKAIGATPVKSYVVNRQSGKVYAIKQAPDHTLESGAIVPHTRRIGVKGYDIVSSTDINVVPADSGSDVRGGYRTVTETEAKALWDAELAALPTVDTQRDTYVSGTVLPIWDRLKLTWPRIFHIPVGKTPMLGILVPRSSVSAMRRRLGAGSGPKQTPKEVFSGVYDDGLSYNLANGWTIKRARVLGDQRIEVVGPEYSNRREWTDYMGGFIEEMNWRPRFFVPVDPKAGEEVIRKLLEKSPVVDDPDADSDTSRQSLGYGSGITVEEGTRVAGKWSKDNSAPGGVVVVDSPEMTLDGSGVRGMWLEDGTILLNVAHISSPEEAAAVLRHEGAHMLLSSKEGQESIAAFVERLTPQELAAVGVKYRRRVGETDRAYRLRLAEEFMAKAEENDPSLWDRFVTWCREWLSRVGIVKLTNEEVARAIIANLRARKVAPQTGQRRESIAPDAEARPSPETPAAPSEPRPPRGTRAQLGKAPPKREPVRSLPMTEAGAPIQPGGRRSASTAEFGAPAYVRQKERERAIFAENFIAGHGTLKDALGAINTIEDSAFLAVTAGEILARAAESLQDPTAIGATDPIDAARVVERAMAMVQAIKTDTAQGMQAQNQVNARIGPFRAVLSYLELIRTRQQRVLGKKFPTVASDNIRDWMRASARKAVEEVARKMKSPDNVVTKALRRLAVEAEIPWAALFQSSWKTQRDVQVGLYKALRSNPDLAKLSKPEVIELTNLFVAAWAREHDIVFQREFARVLGESGVAEPDIARAARALPRIVRWLNLGILDEQRFREAVAPEFGVGHLDDADVLRLGELAQEAQRTPDGVRRNKVYQKMVDIMVASQGISTYDLAKDFWFANILSGLRTWIDVGVGSWVSAFTMTARAAADMTIRGRPRTAYRLIATLIRATGEGLANAADIIATGDTSRLPDTTQRLWDQLHGRGRIDTLEAAKRAGNGWQRVIGQAAYVRRIMIALDYVGQLGARDAMLLYSAHARNDREAIAAAERRFDKAETARARAQSRSELGSKAKKVDVQAREREILEEGIDQDIRDSATVLGKVAALNADPVGWGGIMYRAISHMPWIVRAPLGLSFARAAINMAQNASDWLPGAGMVNYLRSQVAGTDWFQGLPDRHPFRLFGLDVPVERARLIMAAQIGGFVLTAAAMGLFLDDDDDERPYEISGTWYGLAPAKKSQLMSTGERPLSIRVGDKWISFKNTPFASALAFVGNLRDKQRFRGDQFSEESAMERLVNAWLLGALYIKDVSAMSQLSAIIGAAATDTRDELEDANKKLASTLGNTLAGFVPVVSMLREIDTITHGDVYRPNGGMEAWVRNIPFARRTVGTGPAVNALGDDIEAPRLPWGRWLSEQPDDDEWETVARLANRGVFLPIPGKTALIVGRDGARRQMTPAEYHQYAREAGKLWREEIRSNRDFLRSADADEARSWFSRRSDRLNRRARSGIRVTE